MEINYHYFAVKVLAMKAGFCEMDAQRIAFYSQAISDFNTNKPILLNKIPSYALHLAKKESGKWLFFPVTTGFDSWFNYEQLALKSNQRSIAIPFHFIPTQKLNDPVSSRSEYRVIAATMSTPSLIRDMLLEAREAYCNETISSNLIRIGILLHIFADTYAHQNFSGFSGWENNAQLTSATKLNISQDIQSSYNPQGQIQPPPVGSANLQRIPNDANLLFYWKQQQTGKDDYSLFCSRNNMEEFCKVSLEILNYLRSCRKRKPITNTSWSEFEGNLKECFLTSENQFDGLSAHWQKHFPNVEFCYEKTDLFEPTDDFFQFNVFADDIRRRVNGITDRGTDFAKYIAQVSVDEE